MQLCVLETKTNKVNVKFNLFMSFLTFLMDETLQMEYLWGLLIARWNKMKI